jgi:hypothetical protein
MKSKRLKIGYFLCFVTAMAFVPMVAAKFRRKERPVRVIALSATDYRVVEKSILKIVPVGSRAELVQQVLEENDFSRVEKSFAFMRYVKQED